MGLAWAITYRSPRVSLRVHVRQRRGAGVHSVQQGVFQTRSAWRRRRLVHNGVQGAQRVAKFGAPRNDVRLEPGAPGYARLGPADALQRFPVAPRIQWPPLLQHPSELPIWLQTTFQRLQGARATRPAQLAGVRRRRGSSCCPCHREALKPGLPRHAPPPRIRHLADRRTTRRAKPFVGTVSIHRGGARGGILQIRLLFA